MRTLLCVLLLAFAVVQAELDPNDLQNKFSELGYDGPSPPSVEQGQKAFEDQCRKNGGEEAVENGKKAQQEMVDCVQSLINVTAVNAEIEEAKPTGELDAVFKKYCRKTPDLMKCTEKLTENIDGCLAEDQKKVSGIVLNVSRTLLNFTCFKEGDRIALFIAEGGPECLESKKEGIQKCLNQTFGKYANSFAQANLTDLSNFNLPLVLFDEGQCDEIDEAAQCVVKVLEECKDPTPANVVESVLKVVKKVIPCKQQSHQPVTSKDLNAKSSSSMKTPMMIAVLASVVSTFVGHF
ncbi:27 kDa hemolymph protein-like [Neocloeon triangulifer]|uniref:27 kDa hemolymph protein-like n=1 Tax=Neocloeon triangulifer TaxID=2078957 RepID=UPI00286F179E|nr:27 kDa hemolymph protein-like [Neocloeon triangulifer]